MAKLELVIDIGSKNITVLKKDSGVVIKEPTIVVAESNRNKADFVAWGRSAKSRLTKAENLQIVYPIKGGAIAHENGAIYMFKEIFASLIQAFVKAEDNGIRLRIFWTDERRKDRRGTRFA